MDYQQENQCPKGHHWDEEKGKCVKGEPKKAPYGIDKEASDEVDTEDSVQVEEGLRSKVTELLVGKKEDRIARQKAQRKQRANTVTRRTVTKKKDDVESTDHKKPEKDPWSTHPDDVKYHRKLDRMNKEEFSPSSIDENLTALYHKYNNKETQKPKGKKIGRAHV